MASKANYEDVKIEIQNYGVTLLSKEYVNTNTQLELKCSCGKIFFKKLKVMRKSGRYECNDCISRDLIKKQTYSYEYVNQKLEDEGYELLTPKDHYRRASEKNKMMCPQGHVYEQIILDFLKGHRCKKCSSAIMAKKYILPYDAVKNTFEEGGYSLLTSVNDYINSSLSVKVMCEKGHISNMTVRNFRKGARCMECYKERRGEHSLIPYEDRLKYVRSFGYDIVTPKEEYIDGSQKIHLSCNKGHIYKVSIHEFVTGNRCPICRKSKGEAEIERILNNMNINFSAQKTFPDCLFKRKLKFDFYMPEHNMCIEYDGRQHYEISNFFGGLDGFIETKIRDTIKTKYCKDNDIKLIRIPYWDFFNVEKILEKELIL